MVRVRVGFRLALQFGETRNSVTCNKWLEFGLGWSRAVLDRDHDRDLS